MNFDRVWGCFNKREFYELYVLYSLNFRVQEISLLLFSLRFDNWRIENKKASKQWILVDKDENDWAAIVNNKHWKVSIKYWENIKRISNRNMINLIDESNWKCRSKIEEDSIEKYLSIYFVESLRRLYCEILKNL